MNVTQTCMRCKLELDIDSFSINRHIKNGRQTMCRECSRQYRIDRGFCSNERPQRCFNKQIREKQ